MTKDGAVEQNVAIGKEQRISKRNEDIDLRRGVTVDSIVPGDGLSDDITAILYEDSQGVNPADAPMKPNSQASHNVQDAGPGSTWSVEPGSSQLGTRHMDRDSDSDNKDRKPGKRKTLRIHRILRIRRKPAVSKSIANTDITQKPPLSVIDVPEKSLTTHKSPPQPEAEVYDFSLKPENDDNTESALENSDTGKLKNASAAEHDTEGPISHNSQRSRALNHDKPANNNQSPPSGDEAPASGDEALPSGDEAPASESAGTPAAPAKLKFTIDETGTPPASDAQSGQTLPDDSDSSGSKQSGRQSSGPKERDEGKSEHQPQSESQSQSDQSAADSDTAAIPRKITKLEHKVEKTSGKLEKAKANLPTKRKLRVERSFDEESGESKTRLTFNKEVKTQRQHLKGSLALRPVKFAANAAIAKAHMKIYQVEDENIGVKAGHRVEMAGEAVIRSALRHRKLAPYKQVAKLERQLTKRSAKLAYERVLHENPKLKKNPFARIWQKHKIKRQYTKAAREAQKTAAKARKPASLTGRATRALAALIKRNPKIFIIIIILFLLLQIISSLVGMLSTVGGSGLAAIFATTYLSDEQEIEAASLAYSEWEMDLLMEILSARQNHPNFDEYRLNTGEISHCPFELIAYLTATRHIFTFAEIEAGLRALFDEQYQLSFTPGVEVRYRYESDSDGNPISIPYEWRIMTVTLAARNFRDVIYSRMTAEQRLHFDLLMQTRGQRQFAANPFNFPWQPFITSEYGYRIHPISGNRDLHRGIDIGVPAGTPIHAGFNGRVTFAGVSGGFGNVVIIQGADGLELRYAHLDTIGVSIGQSVNMGDVIGTAGSTGTATGAHLHLEILRNGQFLNPIFFTDMGSFDYNSPITSLPNNNPPRLPMGEGTFGDLLIIAESVLGAPYVWGGSGPDVFDCSGPVVWLLNQSGISNVPRTTAQGLFNLSSPVAANEVRPGDLIFFHSTFSSPRTVTHAGIYTGNGVMLHTGSNPAGVEFTSINSPFWQRHLFAFGRIN